MSITPGVENDWTKEIEKLRRQRDELLGALKIVSRLKGFEPGEPYGVIVLNAIAEVEKDK